MNSNFSNLLELRNLQEQVRKAFCYQRLFWPFTVWINCSSDLKFFANSLPSASNFKSFSRSLKQFFLTVGQNNFSNKIPFTVIKKLSFWRYLTSGSITIHFWDLDDYSLKSVTYNDSINYKVPTICYSLIFFQMICFLRKRTKIRCLTFRYTCSLV